MYTLLHGCDRGYEFASSRASPMRTVGPNGKNPPKIKFKKIVKLSVHSYACNDLTNFESKVHAKTGNGNAVNLSESIFGGFLVI